MRHRMLAGCCVAAALMCTAGAQAQVGADRPTEGPRLIGRGAALTPVEQIGYAVKSELCPPELRASLVGGDLSDREVILIAVIIGLALAVVIVAVAED